VMTPKTQSVAAMSRSILLPSVQPPGITPRLLYPSPFVGHYGSVQTHSVSGAPLDRKVNEMSTLMLQHASTVKLDTKQMVIGCLVMLLSAILFASLATTIHYGSVLGYPSGELLMFRGLEQIVIMAIAVLFNRTEQRLIWEQLRTFSTSELSWIAWRGFFGAAGGISYFIALCILPMGDAIAVFSIYPLFCSFCAYFFLREKITIIHVILLFVSFIGVALIAQPSFLSFLSTPSQSDGNDDSVYYLIPIFGAFFAGMAYICMRKLQHTNIKILIMSYSIFSVVIGVSSTLVFRACQTTFFGATQFRFVGLTEWEFAKEWAVVIAMGVIGYFAQTTLTFSAQILEASVSSFIRSSDIIWAYCFGLLFYHQKPSLLTLGGVVLIFVAIIGVCIIKYMEQRKLHLSKTEN